MENISTLIKNQCLKCTSTKLSAGYGFASLFVLTILLIGFRFQLEVVEANLVLVHTAVLYPDSGSFANVQQSVVTNNGPATATNVIVKHYASGNTFLIRQSSPKSGPVTGVFSNGVVTWSSVSIPPGQSVTFESYFAAERSGNQCGELTGEIVSLDQTDPDLSNNKMSIAICPKPAFTCPAISQGPSVIIVNSQCGVNCTISGGSISAPTNACPTGYTLQYQVDGGAWTTTTPSYNQMGPIQTILTRCKCDRRDFSAYQTTPVSTVPGTCVDTDGDGTTDCNDGCPNDANKTSPGQCGCGNSETDTDQDTKADCIDTDDDGDGISDIDENTCGSNPLNINSKCEICDGIDNDLDGFTDEGFTDSDNDGVKDCTDACDFAAGTISNFNTSTCNCNPGYYPATISLAGQTIITGCTPCPPGSYCPDGTNKYLCDVGTFSAQSGKTSCDECPKGKYQGMQGADKCLNCPAGTYANTTGNEACSTCPSGSNSVEGSEGCTAIDTDGDGTPDVTDGCPNDANKIAPGACGCGNPETDSDGDGTPNCNDLCPNDPNKIAPGTCGCGVGDTDSDGDGTPNCNDLCPNDPNKIAVGACGCGVVDTDSDGDGTPNCNDLCPNDPNKIAVGACGCGVVDADSDGDGTPNCNDLCPSDPNKIAPGICGCGVSDTDSDGDGTKNCNDGCPNDPLKTSPGSCGCGNPDIPNCGLTCPALPDADCDGIGNACDVCPGGNDKIDNDGDGRPDCKYPPSLAQIISAWKCSGNKKVTICHKLNNKTQTLCVSYAELAIHLAHGDYLGACNNATCGSNLVANTGTTIFDLQQDLYYHPVDAHLYPNPAQDQLILEFNTNSSGNGLIEIIDITGKKIRQIPTGFSKGNNTIRFDIQSLSSGLHFVRVKDKDNNIVVLKVNKL